MLSRRRLRWHVVVGLFPTAAAGTPTADALKLLASWAASQNDLPTESVATPAT